MSYPSPDPQQFNPIVWDIVRQVPRGQVTTFGQIASMIPAPDGIEQEMFDRLGPRWVGDAMNAVSFVDERSVPWHRVINARGAISLPPETRAHHQQRQRLQAEGIQFNSKDACDLNEYGWAGPDATWLRAHGLLTPRPIRKKPADDGGQMKLF